MAYSNKSFKLLPFSHHRCQWFQIARLCDDEYDHNNINDDNDDDNQCCWWWWCWYWWWWQLQILFYFRTTMLALQMEPPKENSNLKRLEPSMMAENWVMKWRICVKSCQFTEQSKQNLYIPPPPPHPTTWGRKRAIACRAEVSTWAFFNSNIDPNQKYFTCKRV